MVNHFAHIAILAAASSGKAAKPSSSSYTSLLFIGLMVAAVWFLFLRPRSKQAQRQRQMHSDLSVGDEIITGAGIYGTVLDVATDRVTIETAPGTRMTVARSTISRKVDAPAPAGGEDAGGSGPIEVGELQGRLNGHGPSANGNGSHAATDAAGDYEHADGDYEDDEDDGYADSEHDGAEDEYDDEYDELDDDDELDEDDEDAAGGDGHGERGAGGDHEGEGGSGVQTHGGGGDRR